jgi:S1-C subfamily serine protease
MNYPGLIDTRGQSKIAMLIPFRRLLLPLVFVLLAAPAFAGDEDLHTQMMRATVKLQHAQSTAAGFVLSRPDKGTRLLVTAAHVLEKTPGDETTVVFRRQSGEGDYAKSPAKVAIRKEGQPLWAKHPSADVAVLRIDPPSDADLPDLSVDLLADDAALRACRLHPGDNVACLGYPHREEGSDAGFAILRDGPIASFPLLPTAKTKTFLLSANTFEGDSGGPVYLTRRAGPDEQDVNLIVGLISGQKMLNEEMKTLYGTTTLRHRFGLAVVVHASLIRETIELLK